MDVANSQLAITAAGLAGAAVVLVVVLAFALRVIQMASRNSSEHAKANEKSAEANRELAGAIHQFRHVVGRQEEKLDRQEVKLDAIHDDVRQIKGHLGKVTGSQKAPHPTQHERQTP